MHVQLGGRSSAVGAAEEFWESELKNVEDSYCLLAPFLDFPFPLFVKPGTRHGFRPERIIE
jgi:hypothetical protein